jgi:hypothetical protein
MSDKHPDTCQLCGVKNQLKQLINNQGGFRIGGLGVHKPTAHWGDPKELG